MKKCTPERVGEVSILTSSILWSFFPILTILSYSDLEPITALAWTTLMSLCFFLVFAFVRKSWVPIFKKEIYIPLFFVALCTGILFYTFYFLGLKHTSAGNAAIIATLEILFSFLYFNVWSKEYLNTTHIFGAFLMLTSAVIVLFPNFTSFHSGDFLIMTAVLIAPIGNKFQKRLSSLLKSEQILFYRTLIATPVLFFLAYVLGEQITVPSGNTWFWVLLNGIVLFGLTKIFWLEGIFRISITKAVSISSISPIFTLFFAFIILKDVPTLSQLTAIPFAIFGIYLLTKNN